LLLCPVLASARPDPLDPAAPTAPLSFSSPLAATPALSGTAVGSWREANETVNRIGGWRAYAREAQAPSRSDTNATPATSPQSQPTLPDHRHH